jgi:hypothetical protein
MNNSACAQCPNDFPYGTCNIAGTTVDVYVIGTPGTQFQMAFNWSNAVTADATDLFGGGGVSINTGYSSFADTKASASFGQSASNTASGQGIDSGMTSGTTISSGGVTYSLAKTYQLYGIDCIDYYCECGVATISETVSATVL